MTTVTFSWTTVLLTAIIVLFGIGAYLTGMWWTDNDRRKRIASRAILAVIALAFITFLYIAINMWQQLLATH
jgi:apolipoprotein N-acyltransferase